jgi:hypothetical protein
MHEAHAKGLHHQALTPDSVAGDPVRLQKFGTDPHVSIAGYTGKYGTNF